jgi:hypothetical protein
MSNSVDRKQRIEELSEKVELNELRARDAAARYAIVDAELKLMNLREAMDKKTEDAKPLTDAASMVGSL